MIVCILKLFMKARTKKRRFLDLKTISEQFVYKEILNLNPAKSTGLDDISARFIRDGATILKTPITFIVNLSITSGTVPDDIKEAKVKPLYKKKVPSRRKIIDQLVF